MTTTHKSHAIIPRRTTSQGVTVSRSGLYLALIALSAGSAATGHAQQGQSLALEEIVVTATRREEGLQTIPASITAVTAADLESKGITGFKELTDSVSGLTLSQGTNTVSSAVYLRGVGTAGSSPASQSVGVLIDDVYQLRVGAAFTELMDIERVEILRGPQGTLFGKNTTAGVIRVQTADPDSSEFSGHIQGVAGNLDAREVRGIVNIPLIEDQLAARISAYDNRRDGYTENVFLDRDTRNVDRHGYRAKVLYEPVDIFSAKFTAESHEQESDVDAGLVAYGANYASVINSLPPISLGKYQQSVSGETADDVERYTLNFKLDLFDHTFKTIHSKEELNSWLVNDQDQTALNGFPVNTGFARTVNQGETEVETHELQVSSNFDGMLNYVAGYFFQNEQLTSNTTLYRGTGVAAPRPPTIKDVDNNALFGTLFVDITEQWGASVGARYTEDEQQGTNRQFSNLLHTEQFDEWTWSTKLTYQMDVDKMFYIAYDKGFKSGGVNREFGACGLVPGAACLTAAQATWQPETSYNYELGMKSEWMDNRLRLNVTLFHQEYEDFQVTENILGEANVVVTNAAEVVADGIEGELVWVATDLLTLNGNFTWAQVEYDKFDTAPCAFSTQPGCVGGKLNLTGEQLDHAPELSFTLGAELRDSFDMINGSEWFARMDVNYRSEQNLFLSQSTLTEEGGYGFLNGRMGLDAADSWKLTLWGNNLLDEEYVVESQLGGTGLMKIPGLPRTYGLTADWYF